MPKCILGEPRLHLVLGNSNAHRGRRGQAQDGGGSVITALSTECLRFFNSGLKCWEVMFC